jgi:hypothetical protein
LARLAPVGTWPTSSMRSIVPVGNHGTHTVRRLAP